MGFVGSCILYQTELFHSFSFVVFSFGVQFINKDKHVPRCTLVLTFHQWPLQARPLPLTFMNVGMGAVLIERQFA
jgi:hypothetical protein